VSKRLGLTATISGSPYEMTAETLEPCEVCIVKRGDTVTRLFAILKRRHIAEYQAFTLYVHDRNALKALAENRLPRLRVNGEQAVLEHRSRVA
jgi:hypothetical protein